MSNLKDSLFENVSSATSNISECIGDPKGLIYENSFEVAKKVVDLYLSSILVIFGICGNCLSFFTLGHMPGSTSFLLRALAVADTSYLITMIVFQPFSALHFYYKSFRENFLYFPFLDLWAFPFAGVAQTAAVWLVVLVTGDRYLAICHPLHSRTWVTTRRIRLSVVIVILLSTIFNIPVFFDREIQEVSIPCINSTQNRAMVTNFFKSFYYQLVYKTIACFLVRTFIPLIILMFLNFRLYKAIANSLRIQRSLTIHVQEKKSNDHFNTILLNVVTIFIVCETPDVLYRILRAVIMYHGKSMADWLNILTWFGLVTNFLLTINSAINFLVYFVTGENFRRNFRKKFCGQFSNGNRKYDSIKTKDTLGSPTSSTRITMIPIDLKA